MLTPDPIGPNDTVLAVTQLAHASALNCLLLPALHEGASVVLLRTFEAAAALDAIAQFRCTYTVALPAMLQFMVDEQAQRPRNMSSLGMLWLAATPCHCRYSSTTANFSARICAME
jgi:acyl-CoA synthetase (AMP-forming)/AMP-acid ligase II